jgi:hypothetical protein
MSLQSAPESTFWSEITIAGRCDDLTEPPMPSREAAWSAFGDDRAGRTRRRGMELNIDQLFTADSLLTLQGAAAVTYLVPNVLGAIIPMPDRVRALIALIIALALSLLAASLGDEREPITWVVALFNAFLIAGSALGFNQVTRGREPAPAAAPAPATAPAPAGAAPRGYADSEYAEDQPAAAPPAQSPAPAKSGAGRGFRRSWW